ncbi:hypothetical protein HDV06_002988, partial [Boothiomyces sp. JEL0866]
KYWSGKDKFAALKYEIVVSLLEREKIIHVSDQSPGSIHDLTIFRNGLKSKLRTSEKLIADKGYIGESDFVLTPKRNYRHEVTVVEENNTIEQIRQSIERVNHRLKIFNFMSTTYRGHGIESFRFHGECVSVICKITNLIFDKRPLSS